MQFLDGEQPFGVFEPPLRGLEKRTLFMLVSLESAWWTSYYSTMPRPLEPV